MSEPKLISPMLDGFHLGSPISSHDGVCCYPAMKENSDSKYIVKIISIPASQVQLDALLLTGAYQDPASAMDYFQELADGVVQEAKVLKKLSKLEGFLPYDQWQIEPIEEKRLGYHVYLISSYKRSLARYLTRNPMTHLGGINLGLDMCSALAVARRAGYIYADLKPSNIFISEDKQYRIGDLGFLDMNSLKYTSLPSKYISDYTAPELKDALSTVNTTADTYSVGMILYQIYNNGTIPTVTEDEPLPAPANADYELAEIILKACAPDPKDRYTDPTEMGRALVAYMQRNRVNDIPIAPPQAELPDQPEVIQREDETVPTEADAQDVTIEQVSPETASMVEQAEELISQPVPEPVKEPEPAETVVSETPETVENETEAEPSVTVSEEPEPQSETLPEPEPAPQPVDSTPEPAPEATKDAMPAETKPKKKGAALKAILVILVLALLAGSGFIFYHEYYLQTIDSIRVEGSRDEMTVILDTEIDNSLLTVTITDTYGNTQNAPVENNRAHFDGLLTDTLYKIKVDIDGFHELDGVANHGYTTPAETSIVSFTAKTGPEDGSVSLSFAVNGPDTEEWSVTCTAEGEGPVTHTFAGHTATVTGLSVGKTYTFALEPVADLFLVGENTIEFSAAAIITAQNLTVSDYGEGTLTVTWETPEGASVDSWAVHCYSSDGVDKTLTTVENFATFGDIDTGREYTIEVLASGMTEPARTSVSPDPVQLQNIQVNADDPAMLTVTWEYDGEISDAGWHVLYSVDGSETQGIVEAKDASAVIQPRIPGATYTITIAPANGASAFDNTTSYDCPNAEVFSFLRAGISTDGISRRLQVNLLKTPENENWSYQDVGQSDYTTTFAPGEQASLLLYLNQKFYTYHEDITIMYVIRDAAGKVQNDLVSQTVLDWHNMWDGANYRYCELNIPKMPTETGDYKLYVYFNNQAITILDFTIAQ